MISGTALQAVLCCTVLTHALPALAPAWAHQSLVVSLGFKAWEGGLPLSNTWKKAAWCPRLQAVLCCTPPTP